MEQKTMVFLKPFSLKLRCMRNALFVFALAFLSVLLISYGLGVLPTIELWEISGILLAISFAAWFEVHSAFSEKAKNLKKMRFGKVQTKIDEICKLKQAGIEEGKIKSEVASLALLYDESNEPIRVLQDTANIFSFSGLCYLASIFCRLAADYLSSPMLVPMLDSIEGLIFLIGTILVLFAIIDTRELMKTLSLEEDPHFPMILLFFVAVVQALNLYVIWQLLPTFSTMTLDIRIFFTLLFITFVGAGLLLLSDGKPFSKQGIFGFILIYSPWIWLTILVILTRIGWI